MNSDHKLYLYDDTIELVLDGSYMYLDNRPMNNRKVQLHKGLLNDIYFNVRNRDRKLQNVFAETLRGYIIDPTTGRRVLMRLGQHTDQIGRFKFSFNEEDLNSINPGLYHFYVTRSDDPVTYLERPMFSDQNNNIRIELEITEQMGLDPVPTQVETSMLQTGNVDLGDDADSFVSSAFFGNLENNFVEAQHTVAFYPENFTGTVKVQASCIAPTPDSDDLSWDWFTVETREYLDEVINDVQAVTFHVNCNWVRIVAYPETGKITQIMVRN